VRAAAKSKTLEEGTHSANESGKMRYQMVPESACPEVEWLLPQGML
jgi:hypothetical protein